MRALDLQQEGDKIDEYYVNDVLGRAVTVLTDANTPVAAWQCTKEEPKEWEHSFCHGYAFGTYDLFGYTVFSSSIPTVLNDEYVRRRTQSEVRPGDIAVFYATHRAEETDAKARKRAWWRRKPKQKLKDGVAQVPEKPRWSRPEGDLDPEVGEHKVIHSAVVKQAVLSGSGKKLDRDKTKVAHKNGIGPVLRQSLGYVYKRFGAEKVEFYLRNQA